MFIHLAIIHTQDSIRIFIECYFNINSTFGDEDKSAKGGKED